MLLLINLNQKVPSRKSKRIALKGDVNNRKYLIVGAELMIDTLNICKERPPFSAYNHNLNTIIEA